jgi:hypothetical protein
VFIQESLLESSMSNTSRAAFLQARKCWPDRGHEARSPASAKQIYDTWMAAPADERAPHRFGCRDGQRSHAHPGPGQREGPVPGHHGFRLTLPTASAAVHLLTLEQVEALGVVPPPTTGASSRPRRASVPPRSQSVPAASRQPTQR